MSLQIDEIISQIEPLNKKIMDQVQFRLDNLTKPLGSLAGLEALARQFTGAKQLVRPPLPRKALIVMAADHGVALEGVSPGLASVPELTVYNFVRGGAAINAFSRHANAKPYVVDIGLQAQLPADLPIKHYKICRGTGNMRYQPAMTREDAMRAIAAGIEVAVDVINEGYDVIGLGEIGSGSATAGLAVGAVLSGGTLEKIANATTGVSSKLLPQNIEVVMEAIRINKPDPADVIDVLAKVGGPDIAALTGAVLAAAAKRTIVVLDGLVTATAALAACRLSPAVKPYLTASHLAVEPGHEIILDQLGLKAFLKLNMGLGEGTGAALGMTLIDAGVKVLNEMATFDEARVAYALQDIYIESN